MQDRTYDYETQHAAALRALGPECTVLLKHNGDFPLSAPCRVALYGSGARMTQKGGTGSGDVNSHFFVSIEQGLTEAGFTVTSGEWLDRYDAVHREAKAAFIAGIKEEAARTGQIPFLVGLGRVMAEPDYAIPLNADAETAIYVVSRVSGEGSDRKPQAGDIKLTETEIRDILECSRTYRRFLLVLNVGGVVDLSPVNDVENILLLSQLGVVTGTVLADIVLGRSFPSGKLTATWAAWENYPDFIDFGDRDETRYHEGIYVGYRYFDTAGKKPLYPFGYGLGYTAFALSPAAVSVSGTTVSVSLSAENTGAFPGKETVQVYVSVPVGRLDQPYQTLAAFAKTGLLLPGEEEMLTLSFGMEELAGYDADAGAYILEEGNYIIRVGTDSRNTAACAVVRMDASVTLRSVTHVGGQADFADWKPEQSGAADRLPGDIPTLDVQSSCFDTLVWPEPYRPGERALKKADILSDSDLLHLCMGAFQESSGEPFSVIGGSAFSVAGAAGETFHDAEEIPVLVMADGPAGLRLNQHYVREENGVRPVGDIMPAGFNDYLDTPVEIPADFGEDGSAEILDQYCTAIPIGTALAQSWNPDVCRACGDLVGKEMEMFHVDLWLAPAMNIQRSPLCGRNYEYYSEDPLLSGIIGAAVTEGVQSHPGKGATIKHFCCNNQEFNRYHSNSIVSERALREIYLRGFGICIRRSQPAAIMTSYNLLNGIHTAERKDLITDLLRSEWGYRGVVMTDWTIDSGAQTPDRYRQTLSAPALAAGTELFMPGSEKDYQLLADALDGKSSEFTLDQQQVKLCAARVLDLIYRMKGDTV